VTPIIQAAAGFAAAAIVIAGIYILGLRDGRRR